MATIRLITKEEAQQTRTPRTPGVRRQRMDEFDAYARALIENQTEAVVYEGVEEPAQRFVLSLRGAFVRAGLSATVRKMRGRDEVRAWVVEPAPKRAAPAKAEPKAAPVQVVNEEPAAPVAAPRRRASRAKVG